LQYHILLNLVEDLKQKLIAERKKNLTLEANVREELCQVRRLFFHYCRIGSGICQTNVPDLVRSGFNQVSESGSGYRRAKAHKKRKKVKKFHVLKWWVFSFEG
jgi:hypothetical protein